MEYTGSNKQLAEKIISKKFSLRHVVSHFLPLNILLAGKIALLLAWNHYIINTLVLLSALIIISIAFLWLVARFVLTIIGADLQYTFGAPIVIQRERKPFGVLYPVCVIPSEKQQRASQRKEE